MKNHPYYTQQLSQQAWFRTNDICTESTIEEAHQSLVGQLSLLFTNIIDTLKPKQINFLIAVAEGESNFSSKKVLDKYDLGTSANIKNLRNSTREKDLIEVTDEGRIELQDPVFEYWLLNYYK